LGSCDHCPIAGLTHLKHAASQKCAVIHSEETLFWWSWQELAEELEDMHEAMDNVLAILNVAMGE